MTETPARDRPALERYRAFAHAYVANGRNATQAALDAGYAQSSEDRKVAQVAGSRLLSNDIVKAEIASLTQSVEDQLGLDRAYVLSGLMRNADEAAKDREFGPSNRALELLGKEQRMFVERSEKLSEERVFHFTMKLGEAGPDDERDVIDAPSFAAIEDTDEDE